tara:strand:+ start:279 stop:632 length:354 start_codon:yes stop_codon:yes gene_type:complete
MSKVKTVGGEVGRNSWLNFCTPMSVYRVDGSIRNARKIDYWGLFESPKIPVSDSDMTHIVRAYERLDTIAHQYYGSSGLWWVVAERNNIDLPMAELRQGMSLSIPARSVVDTVLSKV